MTLEVECVDRGYLNLYVPKLMYPAGVVGFFKGHRGMKFASGALMDPISKDFVAGIHRHVKDHGLDLVHFVKGERKDDVALKYLAGHDGAEAILWVGRAQEKCSVFRTERRVNPNTGACYPFIVRASAVVNQFYFYGVDDDFGPFFIKFGTYFPAPRGALIYPPLSGVGLEVISQGPMAYLDSKENGDNSMPSEPALVPRRMGRGVGGPA